MSAHTSRSRLKAWARRLWPVAFWLAVWHIASVAIGHDILLVSPSTQASASSSWQGRATSGLSIGLSLSRIATGFVSALTAGTLLAAASARLPLVRELLAPLVTTIKSVPVASFVILILIWVSSDRLSVAISFLMVFPIVYATMLEGIEQTDRPARDGRRLRGRAPRPPALHLRLAGTALLPDRLLAVARHVLESGNRRRSDRPARHYRSASICTKRRCIWPHPICSPGHSSSSASASWAKRSFPKPSPRSCDASKEPGSADREKRRSPAGRPTAAAKTAEAIETEGGTDGHAPPLPRNRAVARRARRDAFDA